MHLGVSVKAAMSLAYRSSLIFTVSLFCWSCIETDLRPHAADGTVNLQRNKSIDEVCMFTLHIQGCLSLTLSDDR